MDETLIELQTRLAFQEDDLKQLGQTVTRQQQELAGPRLEIERLQALIRTLAPAQVGERADEPPPPHY